MAGELSQQVLAPRVAAILVVHGGLAGVAWATGNEYSLAIAAAASLLICNWLLCGSMKMRGLSPAVVYVNVLGVFHLGLVFPLALGIAVGPMPSWLRGVDLVPSLLLLILAFGSYSLGAALATGSRGSGARSSEVDWTNRTLFYVGLLTSAAGVCALLLGIRELGFSRFFEATYFETYKLARTYDPRLFVTSLQLTPMGFYLTLSTAPRSRLGAVALAGTLWAGMIFMLGYRGYALTPIAAGLVILSKRGFRLPRTAVVAGLAAVLIAIPISRQLRDTRLADRGSVITDIPLSPLEAIQEIGGSVRPLVHTIDLMANKSFRWGSTYRQAIGQILPSLSLEWQGDPYLPLEDLPPSHWVSRLAAPWNYQHYGGLGFSAVAEPYMNFGPTGVVVVFGLLGFGLVRVDRIGLVRPSHLACWGMVLGPLLWATRNSSGVFFRPAVWGILLVFAARVVGDSLARGRVTTKSTGAIRAPQLHDSKG